MNEMSTPRRRLKELKEANLARNLNKGKETKEKLAEIEYQENEYYIARLTQILGYMMSVKTRCILCAKKVN
jgi:hypothetical protein